MHTDGVSSVWLNFKGNWFDVGTPKNYLYHEASAKRCFSQLTEVSEAELALTRMSGYKAQYDAEKKRLDTIRRITGQNPNYSAVLIGRYCNINGVCIANSCIDNYTRIGKGSVIENSAIMDRATIGER